MRLPEPRITECARQTIEEQSAALMPAVEVGVFTAIPRSHRGHVGRGRAARRANAGGVEGVISGASPCEHGR